MYAGVVAFFMAGQLVDVDVLGEANSLAECKQYAANSLTRGQPDFDSDVEIVIKCVPEADLKSLDKEKFMALPIAAAGFGTKK